MKPVQLLQSLWYMRQMPPKDTSIRDDIMSGLRFFVHGRVCSLIPGDAVIKAFSSQNAWTV